MKRAPVRVILALSTIIGGTFAATLDAHGPVPHAAASQSLFTIPWGVAVDRSGNLYVSDGDLRDVNGCGPSGRCADTIAKVSPAGRLLARWGGPGSAPGRFRNPADLAVDAHGNVYVLDSGNGRIQKLSPTGTVLAVFGKKGSAPGQFKSPAAIALDHAGNIYVADSGNDRVQVLSPQGKLLRTWGHSGSGPGQFRLPVGIAVSPSGNVYVSEHLNWRVQEFTSSGRFVRKWGSRGAWKNQFIGVAGVAVDSKGYVYVVEEDLQAVQKFTAEGKYVDYWFLTQAQFPTHMAGDRHDNLYITDAQTDAIVKLSSSGKVLRVFK